MRSVRIIGERLSAVQQHLRKFILKIIQAILTSAKMSSEQIINQTIIIDTAPSKVWAALTEPQQLKEWMSQTKIEIITDWKVGSPMTIRGPWYKTQFENKGTVLSFVPERIVAYTHLSSLSRLPDAPDNYTKIAFELSLQDSQTLLKLTVSNFPTEAIYKHFAFYWNVSLHLLKKYVEG